MIELRKPTEIQKLREANKIVAKTLDFLEREVKAGMSLRQISEMAEEFILSSGAKPSFKNLYDFPSAICTSLNEVCIHGIADDKVLKDGDILGLDVGTLLDGYYGDAARTLAIGKILYERVCVLRSFRHFWENLLQVAVLSLCKDTADTV